MQCKCMNNHTMAPLKPVHVEYDVPSETPFYLVGANINAGSQ